jgi:predicted short-subunit dehydrogenase-like oxidoreductase (DUF2520 family)
MRQVPHYIIIGNGRMAYHCSEYFKLLNISFDQWHRALPFSRLDILLTKATHVLLLIGDDAIERFIGEHLFSKQKILIHFSGRLIAKNAFSAHPLMTFGPDLYSLQDYQRIPFIIEDHGPTFSELFPALSNPHFAIPPAQKPYYHALCVMANNFSTMLWQKFFDDMQEQFQISKSALLPYLEVTFNNLARNHQNALTGPLVRGDQETIDANLKALADGPFLKIYQAFVDVIPPK